MREDKITFKSVEIEIHHACNRTCGYCPNSKSERKHQGHMSREFFVRILEQLREVEYRGGVCYHFYNEPLLSPNLEDFVRLTRSYLPSARPHIYTNGLLLTEARLNSLFEAGVHRFTVTKHHGTREFEFENIYRGLESKWQERIKLQSHQDLNYSNRGGLVHAGSRKPLPLQVPCFVPASVLVITVNGNVLPCYEDYDECNVMGNLQEKSLVDIWNSEKFQRFRDDLKARRRDLHPVCRSCNRESIIG